MKKIISILVPIILLLGITMNYKPNLCFGLLMFYLLLKLVIGWINVLENANKRL